MVGLFAEGKVLTRAQHLAKAHIVDRRALVCVRDSITDQAYCDRRFSSGYALRGGREGFHHERFAGAEILNKTLGFFLAHDFVQARQPLQRGRVLRGSGITNLPLYFGLSRSSRDLGASAALTKPLL